MLATWSKCLEHWIAVGQVRAEHSKAVPKHLQSPQASSLMGGHGVRRRVIGGTVTILGVLAVLFAPAWGVTGCAECVEGYDGPLCGCHTFTNSLAVPITWSGDWSTLFLPTAMVGLALAVTGIILLIKARRSRVVLGGCIFGLGLSGILFWISVLPVGPGLLLSCADAGLGLGVIAAGIIPRTAR